MAVRNTNGRMVSTVTKRKKTMTWALIILIINPLARDSASAMTSVRGFSTATECEAAAKRVKDNFDDQARNISYVCVRQGQ